MSTRKVLSFLLGLTLNINYLFAQSYNHETQRGARFLLSAGTNFTQQLKFQGTDEIHGTYNPGLEFGVGILYDLNPKNAVAFNFQYTLFQQGIFVDIHFDENSYMFQKYGVRRIDDGGLPFFDTFSTGSDRTGYTISANYQRKFSRGNHILAPILGVNFTYLYSYFFVGYSNILEDFNEPNDYYQYYKSGILFSKDSYKLGLNLGLHYRYETKRNNAFFADLTLHLYTNHDVDHAEWAIRGKHPDPYQTDRGTIKYSYNRMSLTFGYAF